jgi:hypothetical protein
MIAIKKPSNAFLTLSGHCLIAIEAADTIPIFIGMRLAVTLLKGHNKWSQIFQDKAVEDQKHCQVVCKAIKPIISAIKGRQSIQIAQRAALIPWETCSWRGH